jgi:hypothetical protein
MGRQFRIQHERRGNVKPLLLSSVLLAFNVAAPLQAQQKYPIRFSGNDKAGQKYSLTATCENSQQINLKMGGRVEREGEDFRVALEAQVEILEVDSRGEPFRLTFTVSKLTKTDVRATTELLKPGAIVDVDGSKAEPYSLRGGSMPDNVREAFEMFHTNNKPNRPNSDDDIFGTTEPKAVGESWSINSAAAAKDLAADSPMVITAERLSGKMTVISVDQIQGASCLNTNGELKGDGITLKTPPPGVDMKEGSMSMKFGGCFPVDRSQHSHRHHGDMEVRLRGEGIAGLTLETSTRRKVDMLWIAK